MAGANSCLPAFRLLGVAWEDDILTLLRYLRNPTLPFHLLMVDDDDNGGENDNRDYQDVRTFEFGAQTLTKHHVYFFYSNSL